MSLIHEIDYGTPASKSEKLVTLTIDGCEVTVKRRSEEEDHVSHT